MAVVILGGLVTTTFLSLFVLPALYLRYGDAPRARAGSRGRADAPVGRRRARGRRRAGAVPVRPNGDPVPAQDAQPQATDAEKETAS